ncbi:MULTISPECIES: SagB family peptide dehydrogenase [unclassified Streptomyces]|uniref:SagB family peptide dehydrogenase n=1 Tax=unclassified Streptomyces TaxID=2593676 RepID=UPI00278BB60F|nr:MULTISPECIES: SagB family peptide dehydrogenase [unclassified Streptomyces]
MNRTSGTSTNRAARIGAVTALAAGPPGTDPAGVASWHRLDIEAGADCEALLTDLVAPWAEEAFDTGVIEGWALDRAEETLILAVRTGDAKVVTELRELLTEAVEESGGHVAQAAPSGETDWPTVCLTAAATLTVDTIRATRSRPKRLWAGVELMLAAADAAGAEPLARLRWLRAHAGGRGAAAAAERARRRAEEDFHRDQIAWQRRFSGTADELRGPRGRPAAWRDIFATVVHSGDDALHTAVDLAVRQLGLSTEERVYVAWLASLAALPGPREPYFPDGLDAVDRRYHEDSKFVAARVADQCPDHAQAETRGRHPFAPVLESVPLPEPQAPPGAAALPDVLLARRSRYGTYRGPLNLTELSTLLHHSAAVTAVKRMSEDLAYRVRPYPSAGTRYPLQLVLYCHDIVGLERGTYRYEPEEHALELLDTEDISAELRRCAPATDPEVHTSPKSGRNIDAADCPLWILTVGDLTYQRLHYGLRSYRLTLQESGHLAQNLALTATWLGKSSVGLSSYYDDALNQLVGVDGINSAVLYLHLVGSTARD